MKRFADIAIDSLLYLCYTVASCVTASVLNYVVLFALDKFIEVAYFPRIIISACVYSVVIAVLLGFLGFKTGYREASASVGDSFLSYIPVLIVHMLLCLLFRFNGFIAGPVKFIYGIIRFGGSLTDAEQLASLSAVVYIPVFLIFSVVCAAILT